MAMEEFTNRYSTILGKGKEELDKITMKDKCEAILSKSVLAESKSINKKDLY
jgi:hypothetical protein|tara:strand:+ start:1657 stop:1812 length:156 start_codon:yes stop_codon:yes gene_type:complete